MDTVYRILPILLPALFWAVYHYRKDRALPEPVPNLLACFGLGMVGAGLSALMYSGLEPLGLRLDAVALADGHPWQLFAYATLAIGPIEELAKMLPFLLIVLRFKALDEPLDGIIYASMIGLGYAAVENYHYLDFLTPLESVARGFAAPVIHILFASIWAYWITLAWLDRRGIALPTLAGFAIAALLHGVYDFLVLMYPVAALPLAAALIVAIWIWRLRLMRRMQNDALRGPGGSSGTQPRS